MSQIFSGLPGLPPWMISACEVVLSGVNISTTAGRLTAYFCEAASCGGGSDPQFAAQIVDATQFAGGLTPEREDENLSFAGLLSVPKIGLTVVASRLLIHSPNCFPH